ncbi:SixA phosphatase family protein [Flectobacillus major]|jgi:phosphohistidine phosphatase SixA|uniref:SixA phosphatase family protein n=1 Tax=Flectobacillus major TaxID=103 RepID=UPI00042813DC|nr:histidine phosphatase family protein [Flectobacillus major]
MKKKILGCVLLGMLAVSSCQNTYKIYVVRHAEKETNYKGDDHQRPLNQQGYARAGALYRRLEGENIQKIWVTEYLRVQQTADSLRINQKIDTLWYSAKDTFLKDNLQKAGVATKNVLIVGHSNTVPDIIRYFGVKFEPQNLPDSEYDNLYLITRKGKKNLHFESLKYGK